MVKVSVDQAYRYLAATAVWAAGWVVVAVKYGAHETVKAPVEGAQLAVMFAACVVIVGDAALGSARSWATSTPNLVQFALIWTVLCWLLLLGGGVPAAIRTISHSRR